MNKIIYPGFREYLILFFILIETIFLILLALIQNIYPVSFVVVLFPKLHEKKRVAFKNSPQVRYYRDTYAEHPEDRKNIEYTVHLDRDEDLVTLSGVYEQLKHLDESFKLDYARCSKSDCIQVFH